MEGLLKRAERALDAAREYLPVEPLAALLLAATVASTPAAAQTSDRWLADGTEASATLPTPRGDERVQGATLACAEQRWTLEVAAEAEPIPAGNPVMTVDGRDFDLDAGEGEGVALRIPRDAIGPLKDGLRMELFPNGRPADGAEGIVFSLRGSRVAITAAEERCTPRDMSAYQKVTFTPYSSYMNLARELRAGDIEAFARATASQPELDVAMVDLDEGRRLLFTRLCGSSWYYGLSGCNITGFAPGDTVSEGEPQWRPVYDTENVLLHLDMKATSGGWPDVVTLPGRGAAAGLVWRWNGRAYALKGELGE